ncbi:pyridoxamine 5'-phosphate oxidase-like FMN-binding protein [Thermoplasmatales archaeon BRNA1]|nr:pyridoxamine 5'-phosphate oxidase-like FMN-binding protein [Thermoplasmatales archaeon BRNA1]
MAKIDARTKQLFADHGNQSRIFALATSSKGGIPNVVPIGFLFVANDDEIWVIDNYLNKTLKNILDNPVVSVYAMGGEGGHECVQVKGKAVYETSGPDYEAAKKMAKDKNEKYPAKGLVKISPCAVYDTTPGPNAGKKL